MRGSFRCRRGALGEWKTGNREWRTGQPANGCGALSGSPFSIFRESDSLLSESIEPRCSGGHDLVPYALHVALHGLWNVEGVVATVDDMQVDRRRQWLERAAQ